MAKFHLFSSTLTWDIRKWEILDSTTAPCVYLHVYKEIFHIKMWIKSLIHKAPYVIFPKSPIKIPNSTFIPFFFGGDCTILIVKRILIPNDLYSFSHEARAKRILRRKTVREKLQKWFFYAFQMIDLYMNCFLLIICFFFAYPSFGPCKNVLLSHILIYFINFPPKIARKPFFFGIKGIITPWGGILEWDIQKNFHVWINTRIINLHKFAHCW